MNKINREDYQDDEIAKRIPETYEKYGHYAVRNFSIFNNWRKGETYASIGKHYDLSRQYTYEKYGHYAVRNFSIFNNWRKGETYASIGKHYDLSRQYTYEVVAAQRRLYDSIKKHRESKEQSIVQQNIKKIVYLVDYNAKGSTRLFNCLARHFKENIHDPDWNAYKAISEMTDEEFLSLRNAGIRTLPIFHEVQDKARRRLEEDGSRVDTSNGEAT